MEALILAILLINIVSLIVTFAQVSALHNLVKWYGKRITKQELESEYDDAAAATKKFAARRADMAKKAKE